MPAGAFSKVNVGIRRFIKTLTPAQYRCFEVNGTQQYAPRRDNYNYAGATYAKGATIPYDAATATLYSRPDLLERDFNRGLIAPVD